MPLLETRGAASVQGFGALAASARNYIEDVFSTYLYTGNGSTQTITNGIDLSGKGGLVWQKNRGNPTNHYLVDTVRGANKSINSDTTSAQATSATSEITSFNSDGYGITASGSTYNTNVNGQTYVSWTFRKQAKFFDVVTYTGNGANRTISHSLGSVPGCIIIKQTSLSGQNWRVWHRSLDTTGGDQALALNLTSSAGGGSGSYWNYTNPTSTVFTVGTDSSVNASGQTYVAYLFAHDAGGFGASGSDNVISCGSFTTDGSGNATVTLGYEPQWLLRKDATNAGTDWHLYDSMRGLTVAGKADAILYPNSSAAEGSGSQIGLTATGFTIAGFAVSSTYIYIAIRRGPMKTPTTGTSVFDASANSSTTPITYANAPFPVDMVMGSYNRNSYFGMVKDRLRGGNPTLFSNSTAAENAASYVGYFDDMTGFNTDQGTGNSNIWWMFRRAPGFFDVVCYTGNSTAGRTIQHNLGAVPELIIVKARNLAENWYVYSTPLGNTKSVQLNQTNAQNAGSVTYWNSTNPTSSVFTLGANAEVNGAYDYVAYLFATCPGVSKVGSYTGTGNTLQVNCGFTGGARFVLIKATSTTGDWLVWDSARGIVAGNDPYLALNSTAAEVTTTDWVDTHSPGFELSNAVGNLANTNGTSYIFLAVA